MSKPKFPMTVKRGHTTVKIYLTPTKGCASYTVVHYLGEKRQRRTFASLEQAVTEAEITANKLSAGELDVLTLTSQDRLAYVRAVEALKPTGVPLEIAALQFAEAAKLLDGASLLDAARFFAKQNPARLPRKTIAEVMAELLAAKEADGMSAVYLKDLSGRIGRFAKTFQVPIGMVTTGEIEDFLRSLNLSGRSRNNYRRAIATLFYFAETRGYVAKGAAQVEAVAMAKQNEGVIDIFTPEEMRRLLEHSEPALIPFFAIGAFAGLRHAEIARLDWAQVRLEDGFIEVKADNAKTASRRLVPIAENLKAWLSPLRKPQGNVCPYASMSKQLLWVAEAVNAQWQQENPPGNFAWKHNALRHSFISYRVAQTQNVAQVALEAGNSPRMVFSNYRELVRPTDAAKWFSIAPPRGHVVIQMPYQAAQMSDSKPSGFTFGATC